VKRADVTPAVGNASQAFFSVYNGGAYFIAGFDGDNLIDVLASTGGRATTTATYRDPSAWYHIVVSLDASNATQANRCLIYVNGVQQALGAATFTDTEYSVNLAVEHQIGTYNTTGRLLDGYLADIHFIDGQALDPSSFTEFDDNGVLQPIAYEGTYGTNGFYLPFSDNSTAAALGTDTSGNGNTWTVNNLSVTAGAGNDSAGRLPH
jgi:hypothetical protein